MPSSRLDRSAPASSEAQLQAALLAALDEVTGGGEDPRSHRAFAWMGCLGLAAPEALAPMLDQVLERLFDKRIPASRRHALAAVASTLPAAWTRHLIERLETGDDEDRAVSARALAAPRHLESVPSLVKVLRGASTPAAVKVAAAQALAAVGDASVVGALASIVDDDDAGVRRAAVVALRALDPSRRSVPTFLAACADDDAEVRCAALGALLVIGGAPACTAARQALGDEEGEVRALAVVVLARHGGAKDAAAVRRIADDGDPRVRRAAREALTLLAA